MTISFIKNFGTQAREFVINSFNDVRVTKDIFLKTIEEGANVWKKSARPPIKGELIVQHPNADQLKQISRTSGILHGTGLKMLGEKQLKNLQFQQKQGGILFSSLCKHTVACYAKVHFNEGDIPVILELATDQVPNKAEGKDEHLFLHTSEGSHPIHILSIHKINPEFYEYSHMKRIEAVSQEVMRSFTRNKKEPTTSQEARAFFGRRTVEQRARKAELKEKNRADRAQQRKRNYFPK